MTDIVKVIADLRAQIDALAAQVGNSGTEVTEDDGTIVGAISASTYNQSNTIRSASEPTGLNQSTDVGTIWEDSDTGDKQVWTGYSWVAYTPGSSVRGGPGLESFGPIVLAGGQSSTRLWRGATAPASPTTNWLWRDDDDGKLYRYDGASWVEITDIYLKNSASTALDSAGVDLIDDFLRIYYQPSAPGGQVDTDEGNLWYDIDDAYASWSWSGSAWIAYVGDIRTQGEGPSAPPSSSPSVTLTGFAEGLIIRADNVEPGTKIEYHLSTTEDFAPDATTLLAPATAATIFVAKKGPLGSDLRTDTTYYVKTIATNGVLPNPAPSAEASGQLDTEAISSTITAELVAGFILTGTIQVGQITIDATTGITIPQPGDKVIKFPTDGSQASFEVVLQIIGELVVENGGSLQGTMSLFGKLMMTSFIPNPSKAPGIFTNYPTLYTDSGGWGNYLRGLCDSVDGTKWVSVRQKTGITGEDEALVMFDKVTGVLTDTILLPFGVRDGGKAWGVTRIGSTYYVLTQNTMNHLAAQKVHMWDGTSWTSWDTGWQYQADFQAVMIGKSEDGNRIILAVSTNGISDYFIQEFTTSGSAFASVQLPSVPEDHTGFIGRGAFDFGAGVNDYIVGLRSASTNHGFLDVNASTQAANHARDFPTPFETQIRGAWWDGTRFWSLDQSGVIRKHGSVGTSRSIRAQYSWCDDNSAGAGTHETMPSPLNTAVTIPSRAMFTVEGQPAPEVNGVGDNVANKVVIYVRDPVDSVVKQQAILAVGTRSLVVDAIAAGVAPKTTNEFAELASLGLIESQLTDSFGPLTSLRGDGSVRLEHAVPVGAILPYAGNAAPNSSFLMCRGGTFSSLTYPELAARVGDMYGAHSGTTYYLPDMRMRFPLGASDGALATQGGITKVAGDSGGTDLISENQMPSHDHGVGTLSTSSTHGATGSGSRLARGTSAADSNYSAFSGRLGNTGGGASYLPRYTAINYIIKAK